MSSEGKKRVQFRAPRGLVERADALAACRMLFVELYNIRDSIENEFIGAADAI